MTTLTDIASIILGIAAVPRSYQPRRKTGREGRAVGGRKGITMNAVALLPMPGPASVFGADDEAEVFLTAEAEATKTAASYTDGKLTLDTGDAVLELTGSRTDLERLAVRILGAVSSAHAIHNVRQVRVGNCLMCRLFPGNP